MKDKDTQRALAAVNPPKNGQLPPVASSALIAAVILISFFSGMLFSPSLRQWWHEASARQEQALAAPGLAEEIKLLDEAAIYILFWDRRVSRLQKAAARFGWNELELAKAYRLIEAAKPRFQAVEDIYTAWSHPDITYELLKKEVDELYEQLVLTFCEEFKLVCERGVPPDQARFKNQAKPQALQRTGGLSYLAKAE